MLEPKYPCTSCGLVLTPDDADYHRRECGAFAAQRAEDDDLRVPCVMCDGTGLVQRGELVDCPECYGVGRHW